MSALGARIRSDSGQAFVLVAFLLMFLVGMVAIVVDVGVWYRADRAAQTAADAAALAGAQDLPERGDAEDSADDFWSANADNSPAITGDTLIFPEPLEPTDQITVKVTRKADGFLSKAFGILQVTVKADAQAKVFSPLELKNVAPIAIHKDYACIVTNPGCFGTPVTVDFGLDDVVDPTGSKFGLLNLDRDSGAGAGDMKNWIEDGYPGHLPVNTDYPEANGFKHGIKKELEDAAADDRTLFFPVFDTASASTGYHVIGWAAFVIDEVVMPWKKDHHVFTGHFVTFIATDLAAGNPVTDPDKNFGVKVITLTK